MKTRSTMVKTFTRISENGRTFVFLFQQVPSFPWLPPAFLQWRNLSRLCLAQPTAFNISCLTDGLWLQAYCHVSRKHQQCFVRFLKFQFDPRVIVFVSFLFLVFFPFPPPLPSLASHYISFFTHSSHLTSPRTPIH